MDCRDQFILGREATRGPGNDDKTYIEDGVFQSMCELIYDWVRSHTRSPLTQVERTWRASERCTKLAIAARRRWP